MSALITFTAAEMHICVVKKKNPGRLHIIYSPLARGFFFFKERLTCDRSSGENALNFHTLNLSELSG